MGIRYILSLSLAAGLMAAGTEVRAAQATAVDPKQPTLAGCVAIDDAASPRMTMVETPGRAKHRVKETHPRQYFGRRMQVRGGLLPTVDIAAQAGSFDPVFAAMVFTLPNNGPISTGDYPATGRGLIRGGDVHFVAISPVSGKTCATAPGRQAASASSTQGSPSPVSSR
jgi:hypothetical protein